MNDVEEIEQRHQPQIFWTSEMSTCALSYLAHLVADGIRVDKGFKNSHYNQCAKVVSERFDVSVSGGQVTNHLKTWRTRWSNVVKFKKISSAHFDEATATIKLDEKNYLDRVQKKPSEAKYFNKPIENYHYMAIIFGNQQATGLFAKGTNDPLASDASESGTDTYNVCPSDMAAPGSNQPSPTRDAGESSSRGGSGRKRARLTVEEDDPVITSVTQAFTSFADALKLLAPPPPPQIPPNLWNVMKQNPVFERADLAHYCAYLSENPTLDHAFMELDQLDDKMVWVSRYIKEHLST